MAKYSYEFKLKVVQAYQEGRGGCRSLAKEFGIPNKCIVSRWVHAFQSNGPEALMRSRKNREFSTPFKLDMVKLYLTGEMSYQSLADQFKINPPTTIARWVKEFREQGIEGLSKKKRGRPLTMKNKKKPEDNQNKQYSQEEIDEIQ